MIPYVLPPLNGLSVLVTRPVGQADDLQTQLHTGGASTLHWPVLDIEGQPAEHLPERCDLLIFVSANAVTHGMHLLERFPQARIAAIGASTAALLAAAGHAVDACPAQDSNSESLLQHPLLLQPPAQVVIVRGNGGRTLLHDTLLARGSVVTHVEVYRRVARQHQLDEIQTLQQWLDEANSTIITATSREILEALLAAMPDALRPSIARQTLLCGSPRIATAARSMGWSGELIAARSPQTADQVDALSQWHTRQRAVA